MAMINEVNESTLAVAAAIHSESWRESHASFCSKDFVDRHTVENQMRYLKSETEQGKSLYILTDEVPVGVVSVKDNVIENLYVNPLQQRKGYGTELLQFAIGKCSGIPCLWILDNNQRAYNFYKKHGFRLTGNAHRLSDTLSEVEMKLFSKTNESK